MYFFQFNTSELEICMGFKVRWVLPTNKSVVFSFMVGGLTYRIHWIFSPVVIVLSGFI